MKSLGCRMNPAAAASIVARSSLVTAMLAGLASCAHEPAAGPVAPVSSVAPATPTVSSGSSRYVFLPPVDDGGKSSGPHAVTICLPAGYDATDRRYPVFYVLDGENAFLSLQNDVRDAVGYEVAHDQLVHEGLIQPAIFVAVHNSFDSAGKPIPGNRGTDYNPRHRTTGKGSAGGYYEFLSQKLKPMIDRTYRTRPEPASTGVAGFSSGGTGAFWMTYQHPETFGMGLCESPAWVVNAFLDDYKGPIPAVRLWIDAGSREISNGLWKNAYDVSRKLTALGFRQNDNLAFHTGHDQGHEKFDCNQRMRSALYFLLREKSPTLTGAEIVETDISVGGPIRLARTGHVVLETVYDNWFRLTDCTAEFQIIDPAVASFDRSMNELRPQAAGKTTIASSYAGRPIVQQVEVLAPEPPLPCPATTPPVVVDGDLSDWPELPYKVDAPQSRDDVVAWTGPSDLSYRFGCTHDEQFLYIAIQTTDDHLNSEPAKDPWTQDGVELRLDARPAAQQMSGKGGKEGEDILLVAISPARVGETCLPYKPETLPKGTKAICKATPGGHNTEIAIPVAYLNEKAGKAWTDVRVNIAVDDFENGYKGFRGDKMWWRPDWRGPGDMWGSGTFERQPAAR